MVFHFWLRGAYRNGGDTFDRKLLKRLLREV
jgi:hypothetical protein